MSVISNFLLLINKILQLFIRHWFRFAIIVHCFLGTGVAKIVRIIISCCGDLFHFIATDTSEILLQFIQSKIV